LKTGGWLKKREVYIEPRKKGANTFGSKEGWGKKTPKNVRGAISTGGTDIKKSCKVKKAAC